MGYFPFRPAYVMLTEKELSFRANDSGFLMFGKKVRYSLDRPITLELSSHDKVVFVIQKGEKLHTLNLKGLPIGDIFRLLELLERNPNVNLKRTK
jgi:hypothetical protein